MKNITEGLSENLTTSQYLQIYDEYLENAIAPVIAGTKLFDSFLARIVGWQERNFRRKVSFLDRRLVPGLSVSFLLQPDLEGRMKAYRALELDRGIRLEFLKLFYSKLELYMKAVNCQLAYLGQNPNLAYCLSVKHAIEREVKATLPLIAVYEESRFWFQHAVAFKQLILEKYVRMCLVEAQRDHVKYFECRGELDDVIQVYLLAASRAIDKCDSRQGALTSHIQNWLKTGRGRIAEQLENQNSSLQVENLDFDSEEFRSSWSNIPTPEQAEDRLLQHETIRYLARLADPLGVARAYLGIEELLTAEELSTLTLGERNASSTNRTA